MQLGFCTLVEVTVFAEIHQDLGNMGISPCKECVALLVLSRLTANFKSTINYNSLNFHI